MFEKFLVPILKYNTCSISYYYNFVHQNGWISDLKYILRQEIGDLFTHYTHIPTKVFSNNCLNQSRQSGAFGPNPAWCVCNNTYWKTAFVNILSMAAFLVQWQSWSLQQRPHGPLHPKYLLSAPFIVLLRSDASLELARDCLWLELIV